ncbi:MAG: hypothetical protein WHV61_10355, partial [Burkholderiales bacterium]
MAARREPVLLLGEPGCGFEHCARVLHTPGTPWLAPEDTAWLLDNPLEILQQARGGLVYLHDVGRLNRLEQKGLALLLPKLARSETRLVTSATPALRRLTESGAFDADLYHALSAITVAVPALRSHREDVPEIANFMLQQLIEEGVCPVRRLTTPALNQLRNFDWPGNLPQLNNVVRTLAVTALASEIDAADVNRVL